MVARARVDGHAGGRTRVVRGEGEQRRPHSRTGSSAAHLGVHEEELHDHIDDEDDVDAAVEDEERVCLARRLHESDLDDRHDCCEDQRKLHKRTSREKR